MKLIVFIITISCMQLSAKVYSQKISLSVENITLEKALKTIEQQSGYFFFYKYNEIKAAKPVSVHFENKTVAEALAQCLKGQPFTYTIENKTIVVSAKNEVPAISQPVPKNIKGKVLDEKGQPLPGASVMIKGTRLGVVTNVNGEFELLNVDDNATLVISFISYKTKEVAVARLSSSPSILLDPDESALNEVVVTGLATSIKRSNSANAVTRLNAQQLTGSTPPVTIDGAMSGKVVGANIVSNSGAPGGGISVKLRGVSSIIGSSEPLYVIDGVFVNNSQFATGAGAGPFTGAGANQDQGTNRLSDINPSDIESIEVLKGPSAGAIYGTRANAGVVIITTKKGKAGQTRVNITQDIGFSSATRLLGSENWSLDPLGPQGQTKFDYIFGNGTHYNEGDPAMPANQATQIGLWKAATAAGQLKDYEKIIYGNIGHISNTSLSVMGGNEKTKYYLSAGLNDETGIQKNTGFQRRSVKLNLDENLTKFWNFSIGSNYLNTGNQRSFSGNDNRGVSIPYTIAYTPNYAQLLPVNGVYPDSRYTADSPVSIADRAENNETTNRIIQSFSSNLYLLRKENHTLKFAFSGGLDFVLSESMVYMPEDLQSQRVLANPGAVRFSKNRSFNTNYQGFLIDTWKFLKTVDMTTQVGMTKLSTKNEFSYIQGEGLLPKQRNPNNATVRTPGETFQSWTDVGFVGQQEFNWEDKVIGTVGIRFDKSTLNGINYDKLYAFPRASFAVNISKFDFWKFEPMNQFKVRAAFGRTGGEPNFGTAYTPLGTTIIDGKLGTVTPVTVGNPNLKPETAQEIEAGVDMGFLNNRLTLEATYYVKNVYDLLNPYVIAPSTGVTQFNAFPVGDLQNTGLELALGANPVKLSNFVWNTTVQFWYNRTKVTKLNIPNTIVGSGFSIYGRNQLRLGSSPTAWYGTPNVLDATGASQSTQYEDAQPKYQASWFNSFNIYKNFEFSFLMHRSYGNFNSNLTRKQQDVGGTTADWSKVDNLWNSPGVPNGKARQPSNPNVTAREYIQDASYFRLREVSLYYTVPKQFLMNTFKNTVQSLRVGTSATNLITWTKYQGYNPEVSNFGNQSVGAGVDNASFPSSKRIFFHVAVGF